MILAQDAIHLILDAMQCRHGCKKAPVFGLYRAPEGCICFPDRLIALCNHHRGKSISNGVVLEPIIERPRV